MERRAAVCCSLIRWLCRGGGGLGADGFCLFVKSGGSGPGRMGDVSVPGGHTALGCVVDTAPGHIAAALGRPTLVIFGPTNPLTTRPLSPVAEIVRHPPDCAPCMLRDCPIDHRCMTAITPDEVFARATSMLGRQAMTDKL